MEITEPAKRVFRFAPSPNGELHLGHAFSALVNHALARRAGGCFLLRMEDIDRARCTLAYERQIEADLAWLGIEWDEVPRRQSEHFADYASVLDALAGEGLVYPAFMTRGEIRVHALRYEEEEGRPWPRDPDGAPLYPGLDRRLSKTERDERIESGARFSWRLDMEAAVDRVGWLSWREEGAGPDGETGLVEAHPSRWGDVILARKDMPTSYHLAVVADDALQGITDVVRGRDLFHSTAVHRLLQELLRLPVPSYCHHDLVLGGDGRKLSKSERAMSLAALREAGLRPADIHRMVGFDPAAFA